MKISSTNLSHILGFLRDVSINWICMYFINIFAYEGAILIPMYPLYLYIYVIITGKIILC